MNNKNKEKLLFGVFILFLFVFFGNIEHAHAVSILPDISSHIETAQSVLANTSSGGGATIKGVWTQLVNLLNGFMIGLLIFVAFAQILRININTYGVKKVLPALLMAIVATNFSWLFCRLLVDIANVVMAGIIQTSDKFTIADSLKDPGWAKAPGDIFNASNLSSFSTVFWFIICQFILLALAILMIILAFLFFIRLWVIYFLVAISPLAFMSLVLPSTKTVFNQWWSNFTKWVFMPVVSIFWIWLGNRMMTYASGSWVMSILFAGVCFYMAITTPFKMGGAIMNTWSKLPKKAGQFGYNQWGGAASRLSAYGQRLEQRNKGNIWGKVGKRMSQAGGVLNVPASVDAYKTARKEAKSNLEKAAKKTGTYNRLLGQRAQSAVLLEVYKEDYEQKSAVFTGRDQRKREDAILRGLASNPNSRQARLFKENHGVGATTANMNDTEMREFLRQDIATMNAVKLLDSYGGIGGKEAIQNGDDVANAKLNTRRFNQLKNYGPQRLNLRHAYGDDIDVASSAVGEVIGESAVAANNTANTVKQKLAGVLGGENAEKIAQAALHGSGDFESSLKAAGIDGSALTSGAKQVIAESFDEMRKGRDGLVEDLYQSGASEAENELQGIKMVMDGVNHRGIRMGRMKSEVSKAQEMYQKGDIEGAASIVRGVSGTLDPGNVGEAVEKRLEHLSKGLEHFEQAQRKFADIQDPAERRAAINAANQAITSNSGQYINDVRQQKLSEVKTNAESQAAAQIIANSLASNPAIGNLTASQAANNAHVVDEIRETIVQHSGDSNVLHTNALSLSPQAQAENAAFMNSMRSMAQETIKSGMNSFFANNPNKGVNTSAAEVFSSPELVKTIAKAVKKGNEASAQTVHVANMPAAQTVVQQTVVQSGNQAERSASRTEPPVRPRL